MFAGADFHSIPQVSLGTAALLIFGAIASLALVRGLLRILWGTLVVCISAGLSFLSWRHAPAIGQQWFGEETRWLSIALPAITLLLSFLLLRFVGRFLTDPFRGKEDQPAETRRSPVRWAVTLLLSLIPTALLWFSGATLLRHAGSVAEIKAFAARAGDEPLAAGASFLSELKRSLENALPASWLDFADPLSDEARINLAKLIALGDSTPPRAMPVLEEDEVRALILGDPELRRLAEEGRYSAILRDPRLDRILENPDLRATLQNLDL